MPYRRFLPCFCLFLLAGCSAPAPKGPTVTEVRFNTAVNAQDQIETTASTIQPSNHELYAHAFLSNVEGSAQVTGQWWYVTENMKIYESHAIVTPEAPVAKFLLKSTKDWPVGNYKFVVTEEGNTLSTLEFRVGSGSTAGASSSAGKTPQVLL